MTIWPGLIRLVVIKARPRSGFSTRRSCGGSDLNGFGFGWFDDIGLGLVVSGLRGEEEGGSSLESLDSLELFDGMKEAVKRREQKRDDYIL
jgi:hypothetical protein